MPDEREQPALAPAVGRGELLLAEHPARQLVGTLGVRLRQRHRHVEVVAARVERGGEDRRVEPRVARVHDHVDRARRGPARRSRPRRTRRARARRTAARRAARPRDVARSTSRSVTTTCVEALRRVRPRSRSPLPTPPAPTSSTRTRTPYVSQRPARRDRVGTLRNSPSAPSATKPTARERAHRRRVPDVHRGGEGDHLRVGGDVFEQRFQQRGAQALAAERRARPRCRPRRRRRARRRAPCRPARRARPRRAAARRDRRSWPRTSVACSSRPIGRRERLCRTASVSLRHARKNALCSRPAGTSIDRVGIVGRRAGRPPPTPRATRTRRRDHAVAHDATILRTNARSSAVSTVQPSRPSGASLRMLASANRSGRR